MNAQPANHGADLLNQLRAALTRYVAMPGPRVADAVTLWIATTHAQPAWTHAPRLVIRAPEKRCGKSRLLDVVEATCHEPLMTVNASPSAIYRSIDDDPPTLLVDEADTIFGQESAGNEDLRGLLNAGHQRNRPAIRYDANTRQVESIPTFAMAALAGIGAMPDTIEDRAVIVRMRRRGPGESVANYRYRRDRPPLAQLADQLTAWLRADLETLEHAEPDMPVEDRAADTWEPLVAVADHAGGNWPDRARQAAVDMLAEATDHDDGSIRVRLLTDCRVAFDGEQAISTANLLRALNGDPEAPWRDYAAGGLSAAKLAKLLSEFDIRSGNVRFPDGSQAKGYRAYDFRDAWERYCPPTPAADPSQSSHPSHPRSERYGSQLWDGATRPNGVDAPTEADDLVDAAPPPDWERWDGSSRPADGSRPRLTCVETPGTSGTATPQDSDDQDDVNGKGVA